MVDPFANPYAPSHYPRAALAVWLSAGLLFLLSLCCVGSMGMVAVMPIGELKQLDETGSVPAESWDQLEQAKPYMVPTVIAAAVFTVLPALALIVLGFYVRGGRRGAAITSLVICGLMLAMTGLFLLIGLPGALSAGPASLVTFLPILVLGGLLAWAVAGLWQAIRSPAPAAGDTPPRAGSPDEDPWEHLL